MRKAFVALAAVALLAVPLAAFGLATLSASPDSVDFGSACVRNELNDRGITVVNEDESPARDVQVRLQPGDAQLSFSLSGNTFERNLPAAEEMKFEVGFTPQREGTTEAEAVITYLAPRPSSSATPSPSPVARTLRVPLEGGGIDRFLSTSPRALNFGRVRMGRAKTQALRIYDDGDDPLTLSSVGIGGRHSADFTIVDAPARTITDDDPTSMLVRFEPRRAGARAAELVLQSNSCDDQTIRVPLGGLATEPAIRAKPRRIEFGGRKLGAQARERLTVTNDGEANLRIVDMRFETDTEGLYRIDGFPKTFPFVLKPHKSKTMSVFFHAKAAGPAHGRIVILSNDPDDRTVEVDIFGAGIAPPPPPRPTPVAPAGSTTRGLTISLSRYSIEFAVIASVTAFFLLLNLIRRVRGIPE